VSDYAKRFVEEKDRLSDAGLPDGLRKTFISTLTVKLEQLSAAVVAGDNTVTVAELLSLRSALEELEPPPEHKIIVELAPPTDGAPRMERCRRCGWHYDDFWDSENGKWVPTRDVPLDDRHKASGANPAPFAQVSKPVTPEVRAPAAVPVDEVESKVVPIKADDKPKIVKPPAYDDHGSVCWVGHGVPYNDRFTPRDPTARR
jgi:hypothetical protein